MLAVILSYAGTIVGISAIAVAISLHFAGRRYSRRLLAQQRDEEERKEIVADYVDRAERIIDNGIHSLLHLRVERLGSDAAIRDVIARIQARNGDNPLGRLRPTLEGRDLLPLFKYLNENHVNVLSMRESWDTVIERVYGSPG